MDVWLLGGAAIVLIAITLWIVWPSRTADAGAEEPLPAEPLPAEPLPPTAIAEVEAAPGPLQAAGELSSSLTPAREPVAVDETLPPPTQQRGKLGIGAAIVLALTGAIGGAWLYARLQQRRRRAKPARRLKKRLLR